MTDGENHGTAARLAVMVDGQDDAAPATAEDASRVRVRPSPLTSLIKDIFLDELAEGVDTVSICRHLGINRSSFYRWAQADSAFWPEYQKALRIGLHSLAENTRTIARDRSMPIDERKLVIENEWKLISKRAAGTYADKLQVQQDVTTRNLNFNVPVDPVAASHAYVDMMRGRPTEQD